MLSVAETLAQAKALHLAGDLHGAERLYRRALEADAANAEAHYLLGVVYYGLRRPSEAIESLTQAVRLDPELAEAHHHLGVVLAQQGQLHAAVRSFEQACRLRPGSVEMSNNLRGALAGKSNQDGNRLAAQGELTAAADCYRRALELKPEFAEAHNNLGLALAEQQQTSAAVASYRRALELKPEFAEAHNNLGAALAKQNEREEAVKSFRRAVELKPDYAKAHNNLGAVLAEQGQLDEALACCRRALELMPELADAHRHLAVALDRQEQLGAAIDHYRRYLVARGTDFDALFKLGNVYMRSGRPEAALEQYNLAIALCPERSELRLHRAIVWLLQGRFAEGLAEYEWRFQVPGFVPFHSLTKLWQGEPLAGQTIVMHAEGGLGDTLQFVRYAPLLKQRGARVVVWCGATLHPILARTSGIDALVAPGEPCAVKGYCLPMLSTPYRMQTVLETIPAPIPYVFADRQLEQWWREKLSRWQGFKIGIVWQGGEPGRSIALSHFAPLARVKGARLFSIQKGAAVEQLGDSAKSWGLAELGSDLDTTAGAFMDTAAIMKNLDLVVTCDTAAAHLAGALGVKVWLALQCVPDWRWMLDRADSPWYPTMRLFRQREPGDWDGVFQSMQQSLAKLV